MSNNQKGSATVILLVVLVIALAAVLVYFAFLKKPGEVAVSPTPTATASPATSWKTYMNSRVGYQFEYPAFGLQFGLDETIKYPNSQTKNQDFVQFATDSKDASEQQPVSYGVRTYIKVTGNSIENWIRGGGSSTSADLSNYIKRSIGGQTAYTGRSIAVTYVMYNNNVYVIEAHSGIEPARDTDPIYNHMLATFKFTK